MPATRRTTASSRSQLAGIRGLHERRLLGSGWLPAREYQHPLAGRGEYDEHGDRHESECYHRIQSVVKDETRTAARLQCARRELAGNGGGVRQRTKPGIIGEDLLPTGGERRCQN